MVNDCLVSIIIPMYNVENYIKRCLDSIVNQSVENIEVLLVDDGSIDNTVSICQEYEKNYNYIYLFQQQHSGQGDARNLGVSKSRGKYIVFADADDYYEPCAMRELQRVASQQDVDIVMWGVRYISKDNIWKQLHPICSKKSEIIATMNLQLWDKMFKKVFWEVNNTVISNRYSEDIEVDVFLVAKAEKIYIIPKALYNYSVLREGNLTSDSSNVIQSAGSICNMLIKLKKNRLFEKNRVALQYLCCRDAYYHVTNSEKTMIEEYQKYVKENFYLLLKTYFQIPPKFIFSFIKSKIIIIGNFKYLREFGSTEYYFNLEAYLGQDNKYINFEYEPIYILDVSKELDAYKYGTLDKDKVLSEWQNICNKFSQIAKSSNIFLFHDEISDKKQITMVAEKMFIDICDRTKCLGFIDNSVELLDKVIKNMTYETLDFQNIIKINEKELSLWNLDKFRLELNQNLLNVWLKVKLNGDSLERYFIENNIKNVAIYGMGFLGKHLLQELKNSTVKVSYIVDKNEDKIHIEGVKGIIFGDELPKTEVIIITPVQFFDIIYMELRCYTSIPIISLREVIDYFL